MSQIITAETVKVAELEAPQAEILATSLSLIISTPQDVEYADGLLLKLAQGIDTIKQALSPMRQSTTAAWKAGTDLEKRLVSPLEDAKKSLGQRRGEAVRRIQDESARAQAALLDEGNFDEVVTAPVVVSQGVTSKSVWVAEVVDFRAFVKGCLDTPGCLVFLKADESALNKLAALHKENTSIPGVKVTEGFSSTVRTKQGSWRESFSQHKKEA